MRLFNTRRKVVVAVAVIALTGAACSSASNSSSPTVKQGGVLRIGTDSTIDSLNPWVGFQANAYAVWQYTYPYLGEYDAHNNIVPYFARSWQSSSDGLTWTFHLVSGAKWSDGQPLTAKDVAWTFNTLVKFQNGPTADWAANAVHLKDAVATTPDTVTFHYSHPVGNALSELILMPILPQHVWARYATGSGKALRTYPNTPQGGQPVISGGPFMLVKYQKDQLALLRRNPHWWGPKPHIDGWGFQIFSNDDAMVTSLESHQIDAIETVPFTDVGAVRSRGFKLVQSPGILFYDFIFNSNPNKPNHRELLSTQVRKAFEYAIDRGHIIKVALEGHGTRGSTIVPPATGRWHNPNIQPLPFDLAKANQILDSLGYAKGPNGIRMAGGHPMAYQVIIPSNRLSILGRTFQIIQSDFQKIGVRITEKVLDPSAAFEAITAPNNKYLNFDLAIWDWIPSVDPSFILNVMMCDQYGSNSDSAYCTHTYDSLWTAQSSTVNKQQRLSIIYRMQQMLFNDRPYIVLMYPDSLDAYDASRWAGMTPEAGYGLFQTSGSQPLLEVHQTG
jgi:peptide/nickel transport system substrate-binding protein